MPGKEFRSFATDVGSSIFAAIYDVPMSLLEEIRQKVVAGHFEFSKHAVDQMIVRRINVQEVRNAIARGQIIEEAASTLKCNTFSRKVCTWKNQRSTFSFKPRIA